MCLKRSEAKPWLQFATLYNEKQKKSATVDLMFVKNGVILLLKKQCRKKKFIRIRFNQ